MTLIGLCQCTIFCLFVSLEGCQWGIGRARLPCPEPREAGYFRPLAWDSGESDRVPGTPRRECACVRSSGFPILAHATGEWRQHCCVVIFCRWLCGYLFLLKYKSHFQAILFSFHLILLEIIQGYRTSSTIYFFCTEQLHSFRRTCELECSCC